MSTSLQQQGTKAAPALQPVEAKFQHEGHEFRISVRREREWRERNKKPRAFVWGPGDDFDADAAVGPAAERVAAPTIYTNRGTFPTVDKAWDAFNATIVAAKRAALFAGLREIVEGAEEVKAKYSRKAGCSCGCSPGFVLEGLPRGLCLYIEDETQAATDRAERAAKKAAEKAAEEAARPEVWS